MSRESFLQRYLMALRLTELNPAEALQPLSCSILAETVIYSSPIHTGGRGNEAWEILQGGKLQSCKSEFIV